MSVAKKKKRTASVGTLARKMASMTSTLRRRIDTLNAKLDHLSESHYNICVNIADIVKARVAAEMANRPTHCRYECLSDESCQKIAEVVGEFIRARG